MDWSLLMVVCCSTLASVYVYGAFLLLLNDSSADMPPWVPVLWPFVLPPVYAWIAVARWFGRTS